MNISKVFVTLLFLQIVLVLIIPHAASSPDVEARLLIPDEKGIHIKYLKDDTSTTIWAQSSEFLTYNPITGDILFIVDDELYIRSNSTSSVHASLTLPFTSRACVKWDSVGYGYGRERLLVILLDWLTGNVYMPTSCDRMHVCSLASRNCSIAFHIEFTFTGAIYPERRFLFMAEDTSIIRLSMDGQARESFLVNITGLVASLNIDLKTSYLYWTTRSEELYRCDIDGQGIEKLQLRAKDVIGVSEGWVYWWEWKAGQRIVRTHAERLNSSSIVHTSNEYLPQVTLLADYDEEFRPNSVTNPCENHNCSHLCVPSQLATGFSCLCDADSSLHVDGTSCIENQLLVSTSQGFMYVSLRNASPNWFNDDRDGRVNVSNAGPLTADPLNGQRLWTIEDENGTYVMFQSNILDRQGNHSKLVGKRQKRAVIKGDEELLAFSLDWVTGNVYMVIRNHRRVYACDQVERFCAELLGNQVASDVGGLALHSALGTMYWTQRDDGNPCILRSTMDGRNLILIKSDGIISPSGIAIDYLGKRVCWADVGKSKIQCTDLEGRYKYDFPIVHKNFVPDYVGIYGGTLYWAGRAAGSEKEGAIFKLGIATTNFQTESGDVLKETLVGNVVDLNGFTIYHPGMLIHSHRRNPCRSHSCPGLCLLSGPTDFACACPEGLTLGPDDGGKKCLPRRDPLIFFRRLFSEILMKNGTKTVPLIASATLAGPMSYDYRRKDLYWVGRDEREKSKVAPDTDDNKFGWRIHIHSVQDVGETAPRIFHNLSTPNLQRVPLWIEYDWVGDNIFFNDIEGSVGVCGRARAQCFVMKDHSTESLKGVNGIALDPPRGTIYWALYEGVARSEMDGSHVERLLGNVEVRSIAVDQSTSSLVWVQVLRDSLNEKDYGRILFSDLNGKNVKSIIEITSLPLKIAATGSYVYWWKGSDEFFGFDVHMFSCKIRTGDEFRSHDDDVPIIHNVRQDNFDVCVVSTNDGQPVPFWNPCDGDLCSHICVPTRTSYMTCLCPTAGYALMPNGWTCECTDPAVCNNAVAAEENIAKLKQNHSLGKEKFVQLQKRCDSSFSCFNSHKCINWSQVCDGRADCTDFSDEGPRCNEICPPSLGCSFNCQKSPLGPTCTCPPGEILDDDTVKCTKYQIQTETDGTLAIALPVVGVLAAIFIIVSFVMAWKYQQTRKKLRKLTEQEVEEFIRGNPAEVELAPLGPEKAIRLPYKHILPPDSIITAKDTVLGSGEFGIVHPGFFNGEAVAVKTFKRSIQVDDFKEILLEFKIMAYLGDHSNVIKFVGADVSQMQDRKVTVVTELSPYGDLQKYLWKVASTGLGFQQRDYVNFMGAPQAVSLGTLFQWCEQISSGMEHLEMKEIVHGDLAARNVLVFRNNVVKITDFGMSRQLDGSSTYTSKRQRKLPWKWASIELLSSTEFSSASDVWAFGVTAWEIFTLGGTPYKAMRFNDQFIEYLQSGNRLPHPEYASQEIYEVLLRCWDGQKDSRPDFSTLKSFFSDQAHKAEEGTASEVLDTDATYVTAV